MTVRICRKCGEQKELTEFYRKSMGKHGRCSVCKECHKADAINRSEERSKYNHQHREKIRDSRLEYEALYRENNREKLREYGLKYYYENRDKILQKNQSKMTQRFKILQRDGFTCQYCGAAPWKDKNITLEVDHIFPRSLGGGDEEDNLITACRDCNQGKKARNYGIVKTGEQLTRSYPEMANNIIIN